MSFSLSIRRALFEALDAAELGLARVVQGRVQDTDAGASTSYPLLRIGAIVITGRDTQTRNGATVAVRLHTHTRTGSDAQCAEIQDALYALLHRAPLALDGAGVISFLRDQSTILEAEDGHAHGVCEYRALVQET